MKKKEGLRFGIVIIFMLVFLIAIMSPQKEYEIVILDKNGYFTEYWDGIREYKIKGDTISMEHGRIEYVLKEGERVKVNDYSS